MKSWRGWPRSTYPWVAGPDGVVRRGVSGPADALQVTLGGRSYVLQHYQSSRIRRGVTVPLYVLDVNASDVVRSIPSAG